MKTLRDIYDNAGPPASAEVEAVASVLFLAGAAAVLVNLLDAANGYRDEVGKAIAITAAIEAMTAELATFHEQAGTSTNVQ